MILTPQAMTDPTRHAETLKPFAKVEGKPVLASWMGGADVAAGEADPQRAGIPDLPLSRHRGSRLQLHVAIQLTTCAASTRRRRSPSGRSERDSGRAKAAATSSTARANGPHAADRGRIESSCWPPTAFPPS